jgi:pantoate--beta-alanine ligase
MHLFKKAADLRRYLDAKKQQGYSVGFVPTMGALHQGHAALIRQSVAETDITVCSIFVNPTQFNEASDLEKYPRTPEKDLALLMECGCNLLFMPSVEEVYPNGQAAGLHLHFGNLDKRMEGEHRPGHFAGVAQVVNRLLEIVQPDRLFMGQKDFQQFAIVQEMIAQLKLPVKLVMCPTVREADGLAMSSRNMRLTPEQRVLAPMLFQTLCDAKASIADQFPSDIQAAAMRALTVPGLEPEYFEIVDGATLEPVVIVEDHELVVACTAVRLGDVRLIDNMVLKTA